MTIRYTWRDAFTDDELSALHAEGFGHQAVSIDRRSRLERHSLGWVCARPADGGPLTGFVNVAWDGGAHAFLLDTVVATTGPAHRRRHPPDRRRRRRRRAAGCEWLHVDFEPHLRGYYLDACGFRTTDAGLFRL